MVFVLNKIIYVGANDLTTENHFDLAIVYFG